MGIREGIAETSAHAIAWGLQHIAHRSGANMPGKVALAFDPNIIGELSGALSCGSIAVVGTNGKTTVTSLIAGALGAGEQRVVTNATGANLDSGIASALLADGDGADWGVFECDELWCKKVFPQVKPRFAVLLNLFRDQLDRMGEIDTVQDTIASALAETPETVLVYNADDPFCEGIAQRMRARGGQVIGFGVGVPLGGSGGTVVDSGVCQQCGSLLAYRMRQYSQLGRFACPDCGFARQQPAYEVIAAEAGPQGMRVAIATPNGEEPFEAPVFGDYMVYNIAGAAAAAFAAGMGSDDIQAAFSAFAVQGRQECFDVAGRTVIVNLAKNPVGMNQGIQLVQPGDAVAIFINDKEADGHDVSWLWDVDFERLAGVAAHVFAAGLRKEDLLVRLKYAELPAQRADDVADVLAALPDGFDGRVVLLPNYTCLDSVCTEARRLAQ